MTNADEQLKQQLQKWRIEPTDSYAVAQITACAVRLPQRQPFVTIVQNTVIAALSDWKFGMTYKLAGFAICAIIGFGVGLQQNYQPNEATFDITTIAFGQAENIGEL